MKSKNSQYYSRLDHLRFFAASLVATAHIFPQLLPKMVGHSGVTLFMVLSGFILTVIAKGGKVDIVYSRFLYNRFVRIYPLFIFVYFLMLSLGRDVFNATDLLPLLLLQTNIGNPVTGYGYEVIPFIGPIWTISVEFQFYLIFPFLLIFSEKQGTKYLISLILFLILIRFLTYETLKKSYWVYYHTLLGRFDQFLIGMVMGRLHIRGVNLRCNSYLFIGSFILLGFFLTTSLRMSPVMGLTVEALCYGLLIYSYFKLSWHLPKWLDEPLSLGGRVSYSMYLLHTLINGALAAMGVHGWQIVEGERLNQCIILFGIILPVILLVSYFSYKLIEEPFFAYRKKWLANESFN